MADLDAEVKALKGIERALSRLPGGDRARLLRFALEREGDDALPPDPALEGLRGREMADVAVSVLRQHGTNGCTPERAHYRDWYDLVITSGHRISGKNAPASFLTNLQRHPDVLASTEPGIYSLKESQ